MGFFKFAEKVSGFVGLDLTLKYILLVRKMWEANNTVGEVEHKILNEESQYKVL